MREDQEDSNDDLPEGKKSSYKKDGLEKKNFDKMEKPPETKK